MIKKILFFVSLQATLFVLPTYLLATSLVGTSSIVYKNANYIFRNGDSCQGFVRLDDGFTILADATVTFDTFITVSAGMDLRSTGKLSLSSDLFFDIDSTFSSGGTINARNNTIHLGTKTTTQASSVWQFVSNATLDGHGNTLILEAFTQFSLAEDVSVTLKNMFLKTTHNNTSIPIISCAGASSQITFDNVTLELADNFPFSTGRMFFNNDVIFTGTSQFIYQSSAACYVLPHSLVTFAPRTTFYYLPSAANKDLFRLTNKSSGLYFNNSTLLYTDTGIRLTTGRLWFDNKITLSTTVPQRATLTNGLVFGNATAGSSYDIDVFLMAGSHVQLSGFLKYDTTV